MSEVHYIVGHLPFCLPQAQQSSDVGSGTTFPLAVSTLSTLTTWIWRVQTWECTLSNLSHSYQSYDNYTFQLANHAQGASVPQSEQDIICGFGINLTHDFSTSYAGGGGSGDFSILLKGFDSGKTDGGLYYPAFEVSVDFIFPPPTIPPSDFVVKSTPASNLAGTLNVHGVTAPLYRDFGGQFFTGWTCDISLTPVAWWAFAPA